MKDLNAIFCILSWIPSRITHSSRGGFRSGQRRKLLSPRSRLVSKEKKTKKRWRTNIRDVHASWKKVRCLYLYSIDTACTQHKHDKYFSQTKGQMPVDKRFSKGTWNSKLTRGEFVARVLVLRFLLVKKNWCQSRPRTRFIVTMAL